MWRSVGELRRGRCSSLPVRQVHGARSGMGSIAVAQLPATNAAEQRLCRAFWWHRRAVLAGGGVLPHVAVPAVSSVVLIVSCVFLATITQQPGQRAAQLPSLRQTSAAPGQASSHAVFISVWQCAIAARPPGSSCRLHGLAGRSAGRQRRRAGGSSCNALHGDCKTTWWDARAARSPPSLISRCQLGNACCDALAPF